MIKQIFFSLLLLPACVFGGHSKGEKLTNRFWKDMQKGDTKEISSYMASFCQSIHDDGARDKKEELELIKNLHMKKYDLYYLDITGNEKTLIVTYVARVEKDIDGDTQVQTGYRLTSWRKINGKWKIISHSNLYHPSGLLLGGLVDYNPSSWTDVPTWFKDTQHFINVLYDNTSCSFFSNRHLISQRDMIKTYTDAIKFLPITFTLISTTSTQATISIKSATRTTRFVLTMKPDLSGIQKIEAFQ